MKKSVLAKAVSILLIVILIIGIGCFIFIPELYDMFKGSDIDLFKKHIPIYRLAFYMCYIIGLYIVKVIAVMFMILFLIVIIKGVFIPNLLTFVVALICFFTSLSFYVLAEVIKAAIKYKTEVDFTI